MMDIVLGSFRLRYHQWDSIGEMQNYLNRCSLGHILIRDLEHENETHSLTVLSDLGDFGIGLTTYTNGIAPSLFLNPKEQVIVLGHGKTICVIDIPQRQIISRLPSFGEIFQFHSLNHLGIDDFLLFKGRLRLWQ